MLPIVCKVVLEAFELICSHITCVHASLKLLAVYAFLIVVTIYCIAENLLACLYLDIVSDKKHISLHDVVIYKVAVSLFLVLFWLYHRNKTTPFNKCLN